MHEGVYEQLLSTRLQQLLNQLTNRGLTAHVAEIDAAERAGILADEFSRVLRIALAEVESDTDPNRQLNLYNSVLAHLVTLRGDDVIAGSFAERPARNFG
jgi:hypothetical protein